MKMFSLSQLVLVCFMGGMVPAFGGGPDPADLLRAQKQALKPLQSVLEIYRRQAPVQISLEKNVRQELLNRTQSSKGTLSFKPGRFRLEVGAPDDSLLIHDGEQLWVVSQIEGFDGPITQVTRVSPERLGASGTLITAVFDQPEFLQEFRLLERRTVKTGMSFRLEPLQNQSISELTVIIDPKKERLVELSFKDELDNKTAYRFISTRLKASIDSSQFNYTPPADAEVTDY